MVHVGLKLVQISLFILEFKTAAAYGIISVPYATYRFVGNLIRYKHNFLITFLISIKRVLYWKTRCTSLERQVDSM